MVGELTAYLIFHTVSKVNILFQNSYKVEKVIFVRKHKPEYFKLFDNHPKCLILNVSISAFFTNYCPIKIDLSGNTVRPQPSGFQKLAKIDHFWRF